MRDNGPFFGQKSCPRRVFSLTWVTDKALEIANPITPADRWSLPSAANRQVKKVIMFPTVSSHKVSHLKNEREKRKKMFRVKGGVSHGFILLVVQITQDHKTTVKQLQIKPYTRQKLQIVIVSILVIFISSGGRYWLNIRSYDILFRYHKIDHKYTFK